MGWFTPTRKTDKELQDELKALCDKIIIAGGWIEDMERYESLMKELYSRNVEPAMKLKRKDI